jgi:hypothetical protein
VSLIYFFITFKTFHHSHCCLLLVAIGFKQRKTCAAPGGGDSSGEVQALSQEVLGSFGKRTRFLLRKIKGYRNYLSDS